MKKLNYGRTFLLGFGFFGVMVVWAVYNSFVPLFLANKFNVQPAMIGFFMTIDNIAALFIQPAIGSISDRLRSRIGRRLPFMLSAAPIAAIALAIAPMVAIPMLNIADGARLPLFVTCTVTFVLAMAIWRTPIVALMPDITPSRYRSQANGVINFMGGIGSIIAFLIGAKLYKINEAYPFWLGSILVLVAVILVFIFIREPKVYEENPNAERPNLWKSFAELFKEKQHDALRIFMAIFFWFVAMNAIETFFTLYANKYLGMPEADSVQILTLNSLMFVIGALPAGYIGGRIGRKKTISIGLALMVAIMGSIFFFTKDMLLVPLFKLPMFGNVPVVGLLLMFAGLSWSLVNINSLPMVVDLTNAIKIGTYTGLYYLFSTLAAIAGPNINGWIVQLTGNNYSSIFIIGPIFMIAALVSILGMKGGEARQADHIFTDQVPPELEESLKK
jgi:maltose/moltooligosaccharide transporter